ncbi:MAG: hypothetical protein HQK54_14025 [Oligoflexales bacterium]|nr:hypothetical protein [Oligoflexales bacterium]
MVRFPELSIEMVSDKADAIEKASADALVSADYGCLMNINGNLAHRKSRIRGQHIASFLWERTGGNADVH